jgi:hypothetical protein
MDVKRGLETAELAIDRHTIGMKQWQAVPSTFCLTFAAGRSHRQIRRRMTWERPAAFENTK